MKVENGKIVEATEYELFKRWVIFSFCDLYDFDTYIWKLKKLGVKVVAETEGGHTNEA